MDFFDQLEQGRYGSFELKRQVGPNMLKGLLLSVVIHSTVIASPFIIARLFADDSALPNRTNTRVIYVDPPVLETTTPAPSTPFRIKPVLPDASWKVPTAVPPDELESEPLLPPDQTDLSRALGRSSDPQLDGDTAGVQLVYRDPVPRSEEEIPDPHTFIAVEIEPRALADNPQPEYPELARIATTEGRVYVEMYVDKSGSVKRWTILKVNPANLGFEEAVAKVVPRWKFTPAIQQGSPIGVWVRVPFNFRVKK